jgi:hypothetical protein
VCLTAFVILCAPSTTFADPIVFSGSGAGSSGVTLNAAALFQITGNTLRITLRNTGDTSGGGRDLSANTLTGVFFDLPRGITLSPTSAAIRPGALLQGNRCDIGPCNGSTTNVGGEFAYNTGSWNGHNGNHGIASSGYIGGSSGNFNGPDLDAPNSPNGINFGIVAPISASNPFLPNNGAMSDNPLIESEVVFTMAISGGTLLESEISNVSFQYGTDLKEPKLPGHMKPPKPVTEPATLLLLAPAVGFVVRRASRRAKAAR